MSWTATIDKSDPTHPIHVHDRYPADDGGSDHLTPTEARALAAELVHAAEQVEAATLTGAVVDPGDCKPGEFYVAIGAEGWSGPVPFILSLAHAKHCRPGEVVRPCIWGFSAYRRTPGYRTLGVDFAEWMSLPGQDNVIIRRDYDRVAAHKKKRGHAPKVTT